MSTQRTWEGHIAPYVSAFDEREGARPDRALYLILGNQALGLISELGVYRKSWSNAAAGGLTLTSATCPLPIDLIELLQVEWDGSDNPLIARDNPLRTVKWLDEAQPGWRAQTGDPDIVAVEGNDLILNSIPSSATGKLVIRGKAFLPEFSTVPTDTNPLTLIPWNWQLLPAEYIIANLPMTYAKPENEHQAAATYAIALNQMRLQARTDAAKKWQDGLEALRATVNRRQRQPFTY